MATKRTYKRVRPAQKAKALKLLAEGASTSLAARTAKISRGALRNIIYRRTTPAQGIGRPRRLTPEQIAELVEMASSGKRSHAVLSADATQRFGFCVSRSTVGRALRQKTDADADVDQTQTQTQPEENTQSNNTNAKAPSAAATAMQSSVSVESVIDLRAGASEAYAQVSDPDHQETQVIAEQTASALAEVTFHASETITSALQCAPIV